MTINRNAAANYASRLWTGVATFLFVPAYLRLLGPEAFGLVTFSASILGVVFVLDMGMSNTFAREMALDRDPSRLASLLRSLEWVYLGLFVLIALIALGASSAIADHWLNSASLPRTVVRLSVALMLISAFFQVAMALYIGGLLGSGRHVVAAGYQIGFSVVRSGLVLVPLLVAPRVELFFAWQLAASVACLLLLRRTVWRTIAPPTAPRFSWPTLRAIGGFAGGMFGIALISAINTQSDKLVASKVFTLDQLGLYAIASLIGQVPPMLALPLAVTVLPRLTGHVARAERHDLRAVYMRYSFMISAISFAATIGVIVGAAPLLSLIIGRTPDAGLVLVARMLAVGGSLLATQYMPYHLAVASGHTRTNITFGTVAAVLLPVAMFIGASHMGMIGAAAPWAVMNAAATAFLAWRIMPRFLGPHLGEWTWKANLVPLAICVAVIAPAILLTNTLADSVVTLAIIGLFCAAALAINATLLRQPFLYGAERDHARET